MAKASKPSAPTYSRKSNTAALTAQPSKHTTNLSIRTIDNGFMICESKDGPGGYDYKERFSPTRPTLKAETPAENSAGASGSNGLAEAIACINKDR